MHNLYIPVVLILFSIVALFGYEYSADSRVNTDAQQAISAALGTSSEVALVESHEVNSGYGLCGSYRLATAEDEAAPFFYSKVDDDAELDAESRRYRMNCGE
ncbi:hypothetical protein [Halomonas huangheensis]|uniref:Uncharacterized protein n=1 Tax=Halomonas huangheensis TaxID=1178482 RepID=W1NB53_9GAMM|nr:hypothetical protein [Halomonas huangheensis]ALM52708.1 hypothetical protein AR456_10780 [Halomonas huangheensis]ERL52759.1 hypothetical protein BJB45_15885 [Halomonas huangheensis]